GWVDGRIMASAHRADSALGSEPGPGRAKSWPRRGRIVFRGSHRAMVPERIVPLHPGNPARRAPARHHAFAHVHVPIRSAGNSGGCSTAMYETSLRQDVLL